MTTEELLKPRYKVIADWPGSGNILGHVFVLNNNEAMMFTSQWEAKDSRFFNHYPHLFRKLEWWEYRLPEDMPQYVKVQDSVRTVLKIERHSTGYFAASDGSNNGFISDEKRFIVGRLDYNYSDFIPATEQEYLTMEENKK